MRKIVSVATVLSLFFVLGVYAKEITPVSITVHSLQKKTIVHKNGKKSVKWVKVAKVVPKDTVKYIDTITNNTNKTIDNIKIRNPINKNTFLIKNSEKSNMKFTVLYSINGGKTFAPSNKLFIKNKKGKKHLANVKEYNALEFTINKIPAHSKVNIEYQVKIK